MVFNWKQKYIMEISDLESPLTGEDSSLLYMAFVQKKISCSEFLEWAQSETQFPILKSDFFNQFQWNPEVLNLRPDLKSYWSPILTPLTMWDGHLIVAGSYFPEDFPKTNVIFIFCHYNRTEKIWDQISALKAPDEHVQMTTEVELLDSEPESEFVMEDDSEDKKHLPVTEEDEAGELQLNIDTPAPELLQKLDFSQVIQPKVLQAPAEENSVIVTNTKIKFDKSKVDAKLESKPEPKAESIQTRSKINITSVSGQTKTNFKISPLQQSPTPPPSQRSPQASSVAKGNPFSRSSAEDSVPNLTKSNSVTKTQSDFSPTDLDYTDVFTMWNEIQEEMQTYYDKCYLLTVNTTQGVLPQIWSDNVIVSAQKNPVSLAQPSMFNVVAKTLKPYHGYVVPNEINDQFFAVWNESSVPDHITIVPIVIKKILCGFLMGIGPKTAYNKNSLKLSEKITDQIRSTLEKSLKRVAS